MIDVVIPVKDLSLAKSRLQDILSAVERAALVRAMLEDLLTTLRQCQIGNIWLVARDRDVLELGRRFKVCLVPEAEANGYNQAVAEGLARVGAETSVLVLPADLPMAQPADIEKLTTSCTTNDPTVGLVPDRNKRGTNGLYMSAPSLITPVFGPDSLLKHNLAASRAGVAATVVPLENLAMDIDVGEDLKAFFRASQPGSTLDYLRTISFGQVPVTRRTGSVS